MKILILNRFKFSNNHYRQWIDDPHEIIMVCAEDCLDSSQEDELRASFSEMHILKNYHNKYYLEAFLNRLLSGNHVDKILAFSEFDLLMAARLREKYKVPGQNVHSALCYRDKLEMKSMLRCAGIAVPNFKKIDTVSDIIEYFSSEKRKLILKPRKGISSIGIHGISSNDDILHMCEKLSFSSDSSLDMMAEHCVDISRQYHIDGVVGNNKVLLIWPSITTPLLGFRYGEIRFDLLLDQSHPAFDYLVEQVRAALHTLPTPKNTLFHAEIIEDRENQKYFCEIASRIPGFKINRVFREGLGVNLTEAITKMESSGIVDKLPTEKIANSGFISFPKIKGKVAHLPSTCPIPGVIEFEIAKIIDGVMDEPEELGDYCAVAVITAPSMQDLKKLGQQVVAWFKETCVVLSETGERLDWSDREFIKLLAVL